MELVHILSAVKSVDHVAAASAKLLSFTSTLHLSSINPIELKPRTIEFQGEIPRINNENLSVVARDLSMGYTDALRHIYNVSNVPAILKSRYISLIDKYPSFKVGEHERFTNNVFKPQLEKTLNQKAKNILNSKTENLTIEVVNENPSLKNLTEKMKSRKFKSFTGSIIAIGATIGLVIAAINNHRNRLTACQYWYHKNGNLTCCVIQSCTCKSIACTKECNYCETSILNKLPNAMQTAKCPSHFVGCVNCPSNDFLKATFEKDKLVAEENDGFIRCQEPTLFDAFSDLFGNATEELMEIVAHSLKGVGWFMSKLPYIIGISVVVFIIIIIVSVIGKFSKQKIEIDKEEWPESEPPPPYEK